MFGLIKNKVLVQIQPNKERGFVSIPKGAICGQILKDGKFIDPPKEYDYKNERLNGKVRYAPIGEQLDAIWKFINAQRLDGIDLPKETDNQLNHVLHVKKTHPKNEKS